MSYVADMSLWVSYYFIIITFSNSYVANMIILSLLLLVTAMQYLAKYDLYLCHILVQ